MTVTTQSVREIRAVLAKLCMAGCRGWMPQCIERRSSRSNGAPSSRSRVAGDD